MSTKSSLLPWRRPPPLNWSRYPLLLPALSLGLGIGTSHLIDYRFSWLVVPILGSLLVILGPLLLQATTKRSWRRTTAYLLLLAIGLLGYWRAAATHPLNWEDHFQENIHESALYQARILDVKVGENRLRARVSIETVFLNDSLAAQRGRALVYLLPNQLAGRLAAGDRFLFRGRLQPIRPPLNPAAFDFQSYWATQYIHHQVFLRSEEDWQLLSRAGATWTDRAEQLRDSWIDHFRPFLAPDELAVAAALVLGKRDLISEDLRSAYADTGAVHVLAVSGLHVGILAFLLAWLFKRLIPGGRFGHWLRLLLSLAGIWSFAFLTGFSPSVQRAALMFSVILFGMQRRRQPNLFNSLAAAAIFILLLDPQQLFTVGFQLSFAAVAGIGLFQRPIQRSVYWPHSWLRGLWSVLSVSLAAQIGTLPFVVYYFHQFPLYFLLSGSLVIYTAYGGLVLGLAHGLLACLLPALAGLTGWLLNVIIGLQNAVVYYCQQLPGAAQQLHPIYFWQLIIFIALIGAVAIWLQWRRFRVLFGLLSSILLLVFFRLSQVYRFSQMEGVTVYHQYRHSLLEVRTGQQAISLQTDLNRTQLGYLSQGQQRWQRYEVVKELPLPITTDTSYSLLQGHLQLSPPFVRINQKNWLILEEGLDLRESKLPQLERVLIRTAARPQQLPEAWQQAATVFILDGSNPAYRTAEWSDWADKQGVRLHLTATDGAWVE